MKNLICFGTGLGLLLFLTVCRCAPIAQTDGAVATGHYRNLFVEAGYSPQAVTARIDLAFQQLFHGDPATQAVYFPAGTNGNGALAYIHDLGNGDVRSEGMSYGMMIAVQLDKKAEFDAIWNWAKEQYGPCLLASCCSQPLRIAEMPIGLMLVVVAVVPAICEELAFRGFILSGLRHLGHRWRAIILTSIFFGVTHPIFQQSLVACVVGVLLGFIAVQTGSILPGIVFHMVHNSLGLLLPRSLPQWLADHPALHWLVGSPRPAMIISLRWHSLLSAAASGLLIAWFQRLAYARTDEETLQEAIQQQVASL